MSDNKIALKIISVVAFIGLTLALLAGCQGSSAPTGGKGPKVLFFSSTT